jgi:UDP-glucuronate decarboxylase
MLIIVTGGLGFIGQHLCKKLLLDNPNDFIICIDNCITGSHCRLISDPRYVFIQLDICNFDNLQSAIEHQMKEKQSCVSEIYHLASLASPDKYQKYPMETLDVGYVGTKNMLKLALKHEAKLLFTSTSEIYGDPLEHPQSETYFGNVNTMGPRSCYDESKRIAETLCYVYHNYYDVDVRIARIFNTYGPGMDLDDGRVITNFLKAIINNKPMIINGDGMQTRSFCFVSDQVDGLVKLMNLSSLIYDYQPVNIGNASTEYNLLDLAKLFQTLFNPNAVIEHREAQENDPKVRCPDISRAKELLDWSPKISIQEGIIQTAASFNLSSLN